MFYTHVHSQDLVGINVSPFGQSPNSLAPTKNICVVRWGSISHLSIWCISGCVVLFDVFLELVSFSPMYFQMSMVFWCISKTIFFCPMHFRICLAILMYFHNISFFVLRCISAYLLPFWCISRIYFFSSPMYSQTSIWFWCISRTYLIYFWMFLCLSDVFPNEYWVLM